MTVNTEEWLAIFRREYLQDFLVEGGATVKFLIPDNRADAQRLIEALRAAAEQENFIFASVEASNTKVQMIDRVFHEVARQIDWSRLAQRFLYRILRQNGWIVSDETDPISVQHVAEWNSREPDLIKPELNSLLERCIYRDYNLSQEFRIAMIRVCQAQFDPPLQAAPALAEAIERWLKGQIARISEVKGAPLFQKVSRHNARHMLLSLSHWLHLTGYSGLILVLDIDRCFKTRPRPADENDTSIYYTPAALRDAYESLRELVDETDDLERCGVVVLASREFLDPLNKKSVWSYDALKLRIWDEVRDEHRANPLGGLVRLAAVERTPQLAGHTDV
jgi:hypothetical protein